MVTKHQQNPHRPPFPSRKSERNRAQLEKKAQADRARAGLGGAPAAGWTGGGAPRYSAVKRQAEAQAVALEAGAAEGPNTAGNSPGSPAPPPPRRESRVSEDWSNMMGLR